MRERIGIIEALGLRPYDKTAREAWITLRGDASTPKTRFNLTSLRHFKPRLSVPLWLWHPPAGRYIPVTNLFNYRQPPPELGWSVCITEVLDFQGGKNTYDSHNGTDFAIPPGTSVVAAAPGLVLRVSSEYHRGGIKVFIDHGRGLVTTYNHLSRPLVKPGSYVCRGEVIALSGYSGIDALVGFPWTPPHVHFNVWLNGSYVDPFTPMGYPYPSLWRRHNEPVPAAKSELSDNNFEPTQWNEEAITTAITACHHKEAREEMESKQTVFERAGTALFQVNYFPTRFDSIWRRDLGTDSFYKKTYLREPFLDLPFSYEDYDGIVFHDRKS